MQCYACGPAATAGPLAPLDEGAGRSYSPIGIEADSRAPSECQLAVTLLRQPIHEATIEGEHFVAAPAYVTGRPIPAVFAQLPRKAVILSNVSRARIERLPICILSGNKAKCLVLCSDIHNMCR